MALMIAKQLKQVISKSFTHKHKIIPCLGNNDSSYSISNDKYLIWRRNKCAEIGDPNMAVIEEQKELRQMTFKMETISLKKRNRTYVS